MSAAADPGLAFEHSWPAQRIVFGWHTASDALTVEVERAGAHRLMVVAGASEQAAATRVTDGLPVAVRHSEVARHVPVEVAERARQVAAEHDVDLLVSVGGGSTTGLAKAVALTTGLPIVAVPTTYAGSEATDMWGLTEQRRKSTGTDPRVLPRTVIYDAALTLSLPVEISVSSGLNAMAHCTDSMWAPRSDPIDRALAAEGIRALDAGLPQVLADPQGRVGREQALYGAWLAAVAFSSAGSGLHHRICHVLGGMFDLPHAPTHAVLLPYVLALNAPYAPPAADRIAAAFETTDPLAGLLRLDRRLDAPRALRDLGLAEGDLERAVEPVLAAVPPDNPAPVTGDDIRGLLRAAWRGDDPR